MRALAVVFGLLMAPTLAGAHDLWLERRGDALVLGYGHRGSERLVLDGAKVTTVRCLGIDGVLADLRGAATVTDREVKVTATCAVASVFLDGGTWSLTPDGEKNLPKRQCPDAVKAWVSRQYAKWVDVRSARSRTPLGERFEIVPVTDLATVHTGDKATFRVLLDGSPVNGASLALDHKALGETDSAGEVRVKIRATEVESVSASLRRPLQSPDADAEVWEASLTFEVAK